ncbi:MAG: TaqI-like C-terminal specificity domain-containing protein [Ferruginibacter sp.]
MPLFQKSVLNKYISVLDTDAVKQAWARYQAHFFNPTIQANIRDAKEEEYQEGFVRDLFVNILGYTLKPQPDYNFVLEKKTETDATKSDGALLRGGSIIGVIELKDTGTTELDKIEKQVFGYKHKHKNCIYVITSNFEKLRFYIQDATEYEEFDLFYLTVYDFTVLYVCLQQKHIQKDIPLAIKQASVAVEENVTKKLYADYSGFKRTLFNNIVALNPQYNKLDLYKKTQKLLDRLLFIFFAEDRLLLPPNSIRKILQQWEQLKELDNYVPLYNRYKKYFGYLNTGHVGKEEEIFAYNGGLFEPDDILDNLQIDDDVLYAGSFKISHYDFDSEVDVNILGHIFEHSLNEIEEVQAELEGQALDKTKTKRKKDGVFYTPRYITKYIVENTVGEICRLQKETLGIIDDAFTPQKRKTNTRQLQQQLEDYRHWLLQITICDPACGSGAFLNQALDFLIAEHRLIDELTARLFGSAMVMSDVEMAILEHNIFGVDINEEAVDIARLSLWLRTARKGRKLNKLNENIKCGNSLIDDPTIAGDKAFNWQREFKHVFDKGGFDVVIGNPPWGATFSTNEIEYYRQNYKVVVGHSEAYYLFVERCYFLINVNAKLGFIIPNSWFSNKYAKGFRNFILKNYQINILLNFNQKIIFEDANVETSILVTQKSSNVVLSALVGSDIGEEFEFSISSWYTNNNNIISFDSIPEINSIISKFSFADSILSQKLDISNGIKPYQAGYGLNSNGVSLTKIDVDQKIYHSLNKIDDSYKKEIKGKGIKRYFFEWEESYVKWGNWLMSPKALKYHESPKILVRQIIAKQLLATLDLNNYYADQSLYICINYENDTHNNLLFYLCLLNSKLYGFYFRKFYSEEDDLFPKIKVNELKSLPVKSVPLQSQLLYASKADIMLSKNKELQQVKQQLQQLLQGKYPGLSLSKKLQDWPGLSFAAFLKELQKQKIKLSLPEEAEWMHYFEVQKTIATALQQVIDTTDKEIDAMVYALYGLSEEEIKIVEGG